MSPVETPSFVLRQFRRVMFPSKNQIGFGLAVGWGGDVQRRLEEENGTLFTKNHLDQLVAGKMLTVDSSWYRRFETAMVGEEWPQRTVTAEVKDGYVVVPVDLSALKRPAKIVLQLLVALFLIFTLNRVVFGGYWPGNFTADKRKGVEMHSAWFGGVGGSGGGGGEEVCPLLTDVHRASALSLEEYYRLEVGDYLEINVGSTCSRFVASRLHIDGKFYGWSNVTVGGYESDPWHETSYFWDTDDQQPGDHQIKVEFIPRFWSLAPVAVEELTFTLDEAKGRTAP